MSLGMCLSTGHQMKTAADRSVNLRTNGSDLSTATSVRRPKRDGYTVNTVDLDTKEGLLGPAELADLLGREVEYLQVRSGRRNGG